MQLTPLLLTALLLSLASSTMAQVPTDSTALADRATVLSEQADSAYEQGTREGFLHAIDLWTQLGQIYVWLGDRPNEGKALGSIGIAHRDLGQLDSARFYLEQALAITTEVGDRRGEGTTLQNLGNVYFWQGHPDLALLQHGRALTIWREIGERQREGSALGNMGAVYFRVGRLDSALVYFGQALAVTREVGDRTVEGSTLSNIANVQSRLGRPDSALVYYENALAIGREVGNRRGEAAALGNIGNVYYATGVPDSALVYYRQAIALKREVGDRRGEANTLVNMSGVLHNLGHSDSALIRYHQAVAIYRGVGDRYAEGRALNNIGSVHHQLGYPDSAVVYYVQALAIKREGGDRAGEASTLNNLANAHADRGYPDSALTYYQQTLTICRDVGDRPREAEALGNVGVLHSELGYPDSALFYHHQALAIRRDVGDRSGEAMVLANIGGVHAGLGRPDSALLNYRQALVISREVQDRWREQDILGKIGAIQHALGYADSALVYLHQALVIERAAGDRDGEASTLGEIANVYESLGRPDSALAMYHRTLDIARETGYPRMEAGTLHNIGIIHAVLGRSDSALAYYERALAIHRDVRDRTMEGRTLHVMGLVYDDLGYSDSALVHYGKAMLIMREVGDRRSEGRVLTAVGAVQDDLGFADSALVAYGQGLAISREVGDREGEMSALNNLGLFYYRHPSRADLGKAVAYYDSAAALTASVAMHAGSDINRLSYAEQYVGLFEHWALAWLGRSDEVGATRSARSALAAAERGRAQALLQLMRTSAADVPSLVLNVQPLTEPGADAEREGARLAEAISHTGSAALSYLLTNDTLLIWLIDPAGEMTVARQPVARDSIVGLVRALRAGIGVDELAVSEEQTFRAVRQLEPAVAPETARPLGRGLRHAETAAVALVSLLLPRELAARLPESGELVIVPQGPLALVPFSVLPLGGGETMSNPYAIRYAPSLAALELAEARSGVGIGAEREEALRHALVVGNPRMPLVGATTGEREQLAPLPHAEAEAGWLAERLGASSLSGTAATESAVRQRLTQSRLVHLATHGYAYSTDALARESFVALAPDDRHDGLLTVGEILDDSTLTLAAELIVLSACQTGLGDLKEAEGTVGLQRAFLARGARAVLVSLWSVSDLVTAELMQRFYTHWLDDVDHPSKAEALRRAQDDVRTTPGWEHPRFWAGFQLVGAR